MLTKAMHHLQQSDSLIYHALTAALVWLAILAMAALDGLTWLVWATWEMENRQRVLEMRLEELERERTG